MVKITDMGLSKLVDQTILKTFCGTPQYIAPEVIKAGSGILPREKVYTFKVDCWALGVILYILLSGRHFYSTDILEFHHLVSLQAVRHSVMTGRST